MKNPFQKHQEQLIAAILAEEIAQSPLTAVEMAVKLNSPKESWDEISKTFQWKNFPEILLRVIALKIHGNEHGKDILLTIINLKVLHLEDFEMIAESMVRDSAVRMEALQTMWESAKRFDQQAYGKKIAQMLLPTPKGTYEGPKNYHYYRELAMI